MYGKGILKGLGVTWKHFWDTYIDDFRMGKERYTEEGIAYRGSKDTRGLFTIEYPEEKLPTPEEFRFIPFLVFDEGENDRTGIRCTSCGICAKVCPPQCIWIERSSHPKTGKPVPEPAEFYVDVDICMNCGLCAEFCPFDAIIMDHDYELAVYDRIENNIYDKEKLLKPASHYKKIRPLNYQVQETARAEKLAKKAASRKK
jgi:NADH-quinone oxidoreductase subunit I